MEEDDSSSSCAIGSFGKDPLNSLVSVLQTADKEAQAKQLRDLGVTDETFAPALRRSCMLCRRGAQLYPRSSDLAVSFNGGKDACVVLYLWLASLAAHARSAGKDGAEPSASEPQQVIFFDSPDEFAHVRLFVAWVIRRLSLKMVVIDGCSFRKGMEDLVAGGMRAVVMGQRKGDPWMDKVDAFSPSDDGWPVFMRVNPIMDWSYSQIWAFLRVFGLPYCDLYDQGYTSLGSIGSTLKNPALLRPDGTYGAAHELVDGSLERAGRSNGNGGAKVPAATNGNTSLPNGKQPALPVGVSPVTSPTLRSFRPGSTSRLPPLPRTAGVVVVGNEILTGKVHDANAHFLCDTLHSRGVVMKSVEVVPDDIEAIARCVRKFSDRCDFVFTSGGLGPTHDDLTMAGIAAAFDVCLVEDERLFEVLSNRSSGGFLQRQVSDPCSGDRELAFKKMAQLPEGSCVEWPEDGNMWPIVSMRNVYIFAGAPHTCRAMFERVAKDGRFEGEQQWVSRTLWLDAEEEDVLESLQRTVDSFPLVEIGSYPSTTVPGASDTTDLSRRRRLSITFEAFEEEQVLAARDHLMAACPEGILVLDEESA